jgi:hypothetical protein
MAAAFILATLSMFKMALQLVHAVRYCTLRSCSKKFSESTGAHADTVAAPPRSRAAVSAETADTTPPPLASTVTAATQTSSSTAVLTTADSQTLSASARTIQTASQSTAITTAAVPTVAAAVAAAAQTASSAVASTTAETSTQTLSVLAAPAIATVAHAATQTRALPRRVLTTDILDVLTVLSMADWLPLEAASACKTAESLLQQSKPSIRLTVPSSMTVHTLERISQYYTVTALQLQSADFTDDMITALSDAAVQQSLLRNLTTCCIENCEKLSFAVVQSLMASMPSSLHSLDLSQAEISRSYFAATAQLAVPASVKHIGIMFINGK